MANVNHTGISVPLEYARYRYLPKKTGNCLKVTTNGDLVGPVTFRWPSRYTIFFRANPTTLPASARLISGEEVNSIILTISGIKVTHGGPSVTSTSVILVAGSWHDYAIVFDGSFARFFRDLYPVGGNAFTYVPSNFNLPHYFFNNSGGQRACDMQVTNFQMYSRAFSSAEVARHGRQKARDSRDLLFDYHLEEGVGAIANDSGPNAYHAAISGCAWQTSNFNLAKTTYGETSIDALRQPTLTGRIATPTRIAI